MSESQRYFIAKYIADSRRMEPINIGVALWARGRTTAKFLPPEESAPFVNDMAVYNRWVDYWTRLLSADTIESRDGKVIPKQSPQFMDVFVKTQKENYVIVDAGEVVDRVTSRNMDAAATYLYEELVERKGKHQPSPREQAIQLKYLSSKMLTDSGVSSHEEFQHSYAVTCRIGSVDKSLKAHYAIGNGTPRSVFQRVQIGSSQSVCSTSFLFEHLISGRQLKRENCAAMVYAEGDSPPDSDIATSLAMLGEFATVVNLKNKDAAMEMLALVAARAGSH